MSKVQDTTNAINAGGGNTISVINMILLIVLIVLGLTGHLVPQNGGSNGASKTDIENAVKLAVKDAVPAAAPAPAPAPAPQPAAPTPPPAPTKAELDTVEAFYETAYIAGNAEAKVTVIEFSDVECPFCQRHVNNGTLDQVAEKYGDDVNIIFAHFPLSFHPLAQKAGEAIECAGKIGDEAGYYAYKKALFAKGGKPTLDVIEAVATENELDAEAFMACVNGGEFAQKVKDDMAFGRSLGVTGTPGNIVMNNETGEFTKVSGAVPATAFDAAISGYLN